MYPTGHLQLKTTLPSHGDVEALLNTQKQTQGDCQKEETMKHVPNEKQNKNRTNQNRENQFTRYRVQRGRIAKLSGNFNKEIENIKKESRIQNRTCHK